MASKDALSPNAHFVFHQDHLLYYFNLYPPGYAYA
jgi:hypothetical protein